MLSAIFWADSDTERLAMPTGAETDLALATANATSPRVLTHALGLTGIPRLGISQSSPPASIRST